MNRGLKRFFSMCRLSCLIEAYVKPEKYWLVWAGLPVEKFSEFKFGIYGSQSTKNQNSATATNGFEWRRPELNLPKGIFSVRLRLSGPREPHAVSKALGRCRRLHVCK